MLGRSESTNVRACDAHHVLSLVVASFCIFSISVLSNRLCSTYFLLPNRAVIQRSRFPNKIVHY